MNEEYYDDEEYYGSEEYYDDEENLERKYYDIRDRYFNMLDNLDESERVDKNVINNLFEKYTKELYECKVELTARMSPEEYFNLSINNNLNNEKDFYDHVDDRLKSNPEFVLERITVSKDGVLSDSYEEEFLDDLEEETAEILGEIPSLIDNPEFMEKALAANRFTMKYMSDRLKNDPEFMTEAIKIVGYVPKWAIDIFKSNSDFMLKATKIDPGVVKHLDAKLLKNEDYVIELIKANGKSFYFLDNSNKANRNIVSEAVKVNGRNLIDADDRFKTDKELVADAINSKPSVVEILSKSKKLKSDVEIIDIALKSIKNVMSFEGARSTLKEYEEIIDKALEGDKKAVKHVEKLFKDENFIMTLRFCEYDIEKKQKNIENQHTPEQISEGINPTKKEVDEVMQEMVQERTAEKAEQNKTFDDE